jgi:hypothetical protein
MRLVHSRGSDTPKAVLRAAGCPIFNDALTDKVMVDPISGKVVMIAQGKDKDDDYKILDHADLEHRLAILG